MKPVYQTILRGPHANCLQASVASILELELNQVPNFAEWYDLAGDDWLVKYHQFCLQYGVYPIEVSAMDDSNNWRPAIYGYHLVGVVSERGRKHSCVGLDRKIVHDPYPGGSKPVKIETFTLFVSTLRR